MNKDLKTDLEKLRDSLDIARISEECRKIPLSTSINNPLRNDQKESIKKITVLRKKSN
jgi:hypothetical protein